jgi:transposase
MQLLTILNRCEKYKCFVYKEARLVTGQKGDESIEVTIVPRANSQARCSRCGRPAPLYDRLGARRFEFIPLWGFPVFFLYVMRRVTCSNCGVKVEQVPWAEGKRELTTTYMQYLAHWAQKLSWQEVARSFRTSWPKVFHAVEYVVMWGLAHRDLSAVTAIGVDEIAWRKGHKYLTLVYQIDSDNTRLLWIGKDRKAKTLLGFFTFLVLNVLRSSSLSARICGKPT